MVKCTDCVNLFLDQKTRKLKMTHVVKDVKGKQHELKLDKEFIVVQKGKASPDWVSLGFYHCKVKGALGHNWKISKERRCEDFAT